MAQSALLPFVVGLLLLAPPVLGSEFRLVAWNVESGGIQRSTIGAQIRAFDEVDLWALSEVHANNADFFIQSALEGEADSYVGVIGNTGGGDRLLVIFNESTFEFIDAFELDDLALSGGRAPLVVHLRTQDGTEFLAIANHFHRGSASKRRLQAQGLRDWAAEQPLPVVAMGDFNFDYNIPSGPGNAAFVEFGLAGIFRWEKPATLVATQFSDADGNGVGDFDSVLDFVWTAGAAQAWRVESEILVRPGDFPDDGATSDHRPVVASVDTAPAVPLAVDALPRRLRIASRRLSVATPLAGTAARRSGRASREFTDTPSASAPATGQFGRFEGRVVAEWGRDGRSMSLLEDFHYIDRRGQRWTAPTGAAIDGASIPPAFWSFIGGPFEGQYRDASVVHDAHCDAKHRSWQDVHRMFYEACRCGGVGRTKAKVMYYAVYHFGPRWNAAGELQAAESADGIPDVEIGEDEVAALQALIRWRDPSLADLEAMPPAALFDE